MVCLSDWRLRRFASSARYRSMRRTMASTFSRGRPSPPRVSLLHMLSHPFSWLFLTGGLYPVTLERQAEREAARRGKEYSREGAKPWGLRQEWVVMWSSLWSTSTRLKLEGRPARRRLEIVPAVE